MTSLSRAWFAGGAVLTAVLRPRLAFLKASSSGWSLPSFIDPATRFPACVEATNSSTVCWNS